MIQIGEVDYNHLTDIGIQITKYVNRNLQDIIRVQLDILATDPDFDLDGFSPEIIYGENHRNVGMRSVNCMKLFVQKISEII